MTFTKKESELIEDMIIEFTWRVPAGNKKKVERLHKLLFKIQRYFAYGD